MKFGLFVQLPWTELTTDHQSRIYHQAVEQIQFAEALVFDSVWLAEHHFTRFRIVSLALPFVHFVAPRPNEFASARGAVSSPPKPHYGERDCDAGHLQAGGSQFWCRLRSCEIVCQGSDVESPALSMNRRPFNIEMIEITA